MFRADTFGHMAWQNK